MTWRYKAGSVRAAAIAAVISVLFLSSVSVAGQRRAGGAARPPPGQNRGMRGQPARPQNQMRNQQLRQQRQAQRQQQLEYRQQRQLYRQQQLQNRQQFQSGPQPVPSRPQTNIAPRPYAEYGQPSPGYGGGASRSYPAQGSPAYSGAGARPAGLFTGGTFGLSRRIWLWIFVCPPSLACAESSGCQFTRSPSGTPGAGSTDLPPTPFGA